MSDPKPVTCPDCERGDVPVLDKGIWYHLHENEYRDECHSRTEQPRKSDVTCQTCGDLAKRDPMNTFCPDCSPTRTEQPEAPKMSAREWPKFSQWREQNYENQWAFGWFKDGRWASLNEMVSAYAEAYAYHSQPPAEVDYEREAGRDAIRLLVKHGRHSHCYCELCRLAEQLQQAHDAKLHKGE